MNKRKKKKNAKKCERKDQILDCIMAEIRKDIYLGEMEFELPSHLKALLSSETDERVNK